MASLEYEMAGWLRSRRSTVAVVGAGRGCGGLRPPPLPRQGRGLGPGVFLPGCGRLGRRGGGRPWLHSGGSLPVYLVPLWALVSGVSSWMGWPLLSSKVSPSGLSGALLPWSSSFWRCLVTWIYTAPLGPSSWRRYWIVTSHRIQSPVWSLRKGCWTFVPFLNSRYASGWGGACGRKEDDEDAWSWSGADAGLVGRVGGGVGGPKFVALLSFLVCGGLGAGSPLFRRAGFGRTGGGGAGGGGGL